MISYLSGFMLTREMIWMSSNKIEITYKHNEVKAYGVKDKLINLNNTSCQHELYLEQIESDKALAQLV